MAKPDTSQRKMTPGPNKILKIPVTGNLIKIHTIGSGNTFGARLWTDGKMEAPMMPDIPLIRRHPDTGEVFWCDECEEVASEDPFRKESKYAEVPYAGEVGDTELEAELDSESLTPDKERYVRIRLWWLWNDQEREGKNKTDRAEGFCSNLRRLVDLLDENEPDTRLMAAEGLRELGEHERAADLLNHDFPEDFSHPVEVIRKANEDGDVRVQEIAEEADDDSK